jgi:hypothetical protein
MMSDVELGGDNAVVPAGAFVINAAAARRRVVTETIAAIAGFAGLLSAAALTGGGR